MNHYFSCFPETTNSDEFGIQTWQMAMALLTIYHPKKDQIHEKPHKNCVRTPMSDPSEQSSMKAGSLV
jgi:hypothetical protein